MRYDDPMHILSPQQRQMDIMRQGFMRGPSKSQQRVKERKEMWTNRMWDMLKAKNLILWDAQISNFNKKELDIIEKAGYMQYLKYK